MVASAMARVLLVDPLAPDPQAIVEAATHYRDPDVLARVSTGLKDAMPGLEISALQPADLLQGRGW